MTMSIFTKTASTLLLLGSMPMAFAVTIQYTGEPDSDSSVDLKVFCPDENTTVDGSGNKHGESCWKTDDTGTATTFYDNIKLYNRGAITLPTHRCLLEKGSINQDYVCVRAKQGTEYTTTNPLKEVSSCNVSFEGIGSIGNGKVTATSQCECKANPCKNGSGYANALYKGPTIKAPKGDTVKIYKPTNDSCRTAATPELTLLNYFIGDVISAPFEVETHLSEDFVNDSLCISYGNSLKSLFWNDEGCKITISDKMTGKNNVTFEGCGPAKQ